MFGQRLVLLQMTNHHQQIQRWQKWSPLFLAFAILMLAGLTWVGPFSISYLIRALIIGADFSILTIAVWRLQLNYPISLIWLVLVFVLITGGFYWSRDQTFGVASVDDFSWSLVGQFISTVVAVFFGVLIAARGKLEKMPNTDLP